ncbi:MAG: transporter [Aeromicrobium sp.]|nr:transporter [Aeromicrobium sp.]
MSRNTPTVRVARWSATHPLRAIGLWAAFVVAAIACLAFIPTQHTSSDDFRIGDSGRASAILEQAKLTEKPTESVLITAPKGGLDAQDAERVAAEVSQKTADVHGVAGVGPPIWSKSRDALLVPITMSGNADDASDNVGAVLDATAAVQKAHPELDVQEAGTASINEGVNTKVGEDLGSAESMSLPITFAILLVAFGAFIAAGIPVLLAFSSVITALGLYAPLSHLFPDSGTTANVVLLIGMAVGVDYSLFYLRREREERRRGRSTIDAIEIAAETSGRAVVVSGFAVMVAMSGLFLARDVTFAALAVGSILVVAVAMIGSLTVLPALLSKLGRFADRPRIPLLWRLNRRIGAGGISGRLVRPIIRRPWLSAVLAGGALLALAGPALGMTTHQGTINTLPQDIPAVHAYQRMQQSFPSERPSIDVVLQSTRGNSAAATVALQKIQQQAIAAHIATASDAPIRTSSDGRTTVLSMFANHHESDPRIDGGIEQLRNSIIPRAAGNIDATTTYVGGVAAEDYDYEHRASTLPWVIGFVLILTLVMMGWTFRSVTIALITTALNLLSVGAAFGVLTLVFQHSWANGPLNYTSSGFVVDWIPLFCFVILIGLSMDYHVFVLSRVREGLRRGLPYERAVEFGIRETASVVTSAAAVMVSVFAVFATLSMLEMKQMGIGLSVAILLDATLVRLVLLPALLLLFKGRLQGLARVPAQQVERELQPA